VFETTLLRKSSDLKEEETGRWTLMSFTICALHQILLQLSKQDGLDARVMYTREKMRNFGRKI
jgi:hypothetical protein